MSDTENSDTENYLLSLRDLQLWFQWEHEKLMARDDNGKYVFGANTYKQLLKKLYNIYEERIDNLRELYSIKDVKAEEVSFGGKEWKEVFDAWILEFEQQAKEDREGK